MPRPRQERGTPHELAPHRTAWPSTQSQRHDPARLSVQRVNAGDASSRARFGVAVQEYVNVRGDLGVAGGRSALRVGEPLAVDERDEVARCRLRVGDRQTSRLPELLQARDYRGAYAPRSGLQPGVDDLGRELVGFGGNAADEGEVLGEARAVSDDRLGENDQVSLGVSAAEAGVDFVDESVGDAGGARDEYRGEQLQLVLEVVVDRACRYSGVLSDEVDARARLPQAPEDAESRLLDGLALVAPQSRGRFLRARWVSHRVSLADASGHLAWLHDRCRLSGWWSARRSGSHPSADCRVRFTFGVSG